ncbi:Fic family protein [Trinickia diaoshuihuensis]|uniref:Fic family protein n=1 Tax=Trinickia diaoshuihuensis TaxID=2292265 RepID=UPI000E23B8E1|nr:Fic family protein [Trinickia diaoshuihuensis]
MAELEPVGYQHLIEHLNLESRVRPLEAPAYLNGSVNQKVRGHNGFWYPRKTAVEQTLIGHVEFALRNEGVNLEVLEAVFEHLPEAELLRRWSESPNSTFVRRACFFWEWLTGGNLVVEKSPSGAYVDALPDADYFTADSAHATRHQKFRVRDNLPGTRDFCPLVRRDALAAGPSLDELLDEASLTLEQVSDAALYERAVRYLFLSETRSSYSIERETPSGNKGERFVQLLARAGEEERVTEEWLVDLQNVIVRDSYAQEASYRTKQNWLEDGTGRVTFFPPPPEDLTRAMRGWEAFINEQSSAGGHRCSNVLVRSACAAFGFVYLHPFLDGNGRIHRFLIHHVINGARRLKGGAIVPVSAVFKRHEDSYLDVLNGFSRPTTRLWQYAPGEDAPHVMSSPGGRPYRFFDATREVRFLHRMLIEAVRTELPRELHWLSGFDTAFEQLNGELNLPRSDLSALIRMVQSNNGKLSSNKRKRYPHLPDEVILRIEEVVRETFESASAQTSDDGESSPN